MIDWTQISGLRQISGKEWLLNPPATSIASYSSFITTTSVAKQDNGDLEFRGSDNKYYRCNILSDNSSISVIHSAAHATLNRIDLIVFKPSSNSIYAKSGVASASPAPPVKLGDEIEINTVTIFSQAINDPGDPAPIPTVDYFKTTTVESDGSGNLVLDVSFSKSHLALAENITNITITGEPSGKVHVLQIPGNAAYSITWSSNFYTDKAPRIPSTVTTDRNIYTIQQDDSTPNSGDYFYVLTNIIDKS